MDPLPDIEIEVDRELFFGVGRSLQRGIGKKVLGDIALAVRGKILYVSSDWGGGEIPCAGGSDVDARLSAKAFCQLITSRYREAQPHGNMVMVFRRSMKEVAIDRVGVRAKFPTAG